MTISSMMAREKYSKDEDLDAIYASNVMKKGAFKLDKHDKAGQDEEAAVDMKMYQSKPMDMEAAARQALQASQRLSRASANCSQCHPVLVVSSALHVVLCLVPAPFALHPLHCQLIPIEHVSNSLQGDLTVELERYKTCIQSMFAQAGCHMVVMEAAVQYGRHPHAIVDILPIDKGMETDVKMFFKEVSACSASAAVAVAAYRSAVCGSWCVCFSGFGVSCSTKIRNPKSCSRSHSLHSPGPCPSAQQP